MDLSFSNFSIPFNEISLCGLLSLSSRTSIFGNRSEIQLKSSVLGSSSPNQIALLQSAPFTKKIV